MLCRKMNFIILFLATAVCVQSYSLDRRRSTCATTRNRTNVIIPLNTRYTRNYDYRLNSPIKPVEYEITITTHLSNDDPAQFTFDGYVEIALGTPFFDVSQIVLHVGVDLKISSVNIRNERSIYWNAIGNVLYEAWSEKLYVNLKMPLVPLQLYYLSFNYTGQMNSKAQGFYARKHLNSKKEEVWIGATQLQVVHARQVFPCFDEPHMKAAFNLHINRSSEYHSVSNAQISSIEQLEGGRFMDNFFTTPKMSTYLLAFVVSDYRIQDNGRGFYTLVHPQFYSQSQFALSVVADLADYMYLYLKYPYFSTSSVSKIGLAAVPDGTAMENWGLILFSEFDLLYDANKSSMQNKQYTMAVIAHELAHTWFGNLITCEWWSYSWLNEGFARYFEYYAVQAIDKSWEMTKQFIVDQIQRSLFMESRFYNEKLTELETNAPFEADEMFGEVNYRKGAAIVRMFNHIMGAQNFRTALQSYVRDNVYSTGTPEKLLLSLNQHFDSHDLVNISEILIDWTEQSRYPLVLFRLVGGNKVEISQSIFHLDKPQALESKYAWTIPVTFTTDWELNFTVSRPRAYLKKNSSLTYHLANHTDWIIGNLHQFGYYRVNYDRANWIEIGHALKRRRYSKIPDTVRAQIIDDAFNLARASLLDYDIVFDIVEYLVFETSYLPWVPALDALNQISLRMEARYPQTFREYMVFLTEREYHRISYRSRSSDSTLTRYHRSQLVYWACRYGVERCIFDTRRAFYNDMIPADLVVPTYCTVLRETSSEYEFDRVWHIFKNETFPARRIALLEALGCVKDKQLTRKLIRFILSSYIAINEKPIALDALFEQNFENREMIWKYIVDHGDDVERIFQGTTNLIDLFCRYSKYLNDFNLVDFIQKDGVNLRNPESAEDFLQCLSYMDIEEHWNHHFRKPVHLIMRKYLQTPTNDEISFIQIVNYYLHVIIYNCVVKPCSWICFIFDSMQDFFDKIYSIYF